MKKDWMVKESELDDDQINVLMATNDRSLVVAGCAGSGKSVLALIKAQRIQKEIGDNYKVIVYTKALRSFMESGRSELGIKNSFCYYWEWKNQNKQPKADYIIVDEIQDFNKTEILEFIHAANQRFFFFGDTAQSIYDGYPNKGRTLPVDDIPSLTNPRTRIRELYRNYRLPIPIAKLVQHIGIDLPPFTENTYRSKEKSMPRILNTPDQITQLKKILKNKSDSAILLPNNNSVRLLSIEFEKQSIKHEVKYSLDNKTKNTLNFSTSLPKLMTYHSAKGLQFENIMLPFLEQYSEQEDRNRKALYVAMTRTYKELYILYSGSIPSVLSQIPTNLYKTTEVDEIEDI